jgi:hypothetical protein
MGENVKPKESTSEIKYRVTGLRGGWDWCGVWIEKYWNTMLTAIYRSRDGIYQNRERGFLMLVNGKAILRTRVQVGYAGHVTLKMKGIADKLNVESKLVSFHSHIGEGHDRPSMRDKETAVALGEEYTVIGYFKNGSPHIKVWRIYERAGVFFIGRETERKIGSRLILTI